MLGFSSLVFPEVLILVHLTLAAAEPLPTVAGATSKLVLAVVLVEFCIVLVLLVETSSASDSEADSELLSCPLRP